MNELSKAAVARLMIDESSEGQRIDNFLTRILKGVPKSHLYRILRSGEVRLNGKRVKPDARLTSGDSVRVPPVAIAQPTRRAAVRPLSPPIVHEDDDFLAVDKPAGLAVHGGSGVAQGLIEGLRAARPHARFLELVHRLDRETSGLLLVAKRRAALTELHRLLRAGEIDKRYVVLVRGRWRDAKRTVRLPLHKYVTREGERRVRIDDQTGREAITTLRRLAVWQAHDPPLALLEAELVTGRTHQIRVHLAHLGYPLAGDPKYGDFDWNKVLARQGLKRMFLHARELSFTHPATGTRVALRSELPPDLAAFVDTLNVAERS